MNYSLQLSPDFQKNAPEHTNVVNTDNDQLSYGFDYHKIQTIKKCINFDQYKTLDMKCFVSFDDVKFNDNIDSIPHTNFHVLTPENYHDTLPAIHNKFNILEFISKDHGFDKSTILCKWNTSLHASKGIYVDRQDAYNEIIPFIDPSCKINKPSIMKIMDEYDSVITFHKYFKCLNHYGCSLMMFCLKKQQKLLTNNSKTICLPNGSYYLNEFSNKSIDDDNIDNFYDAFCKIKCTDNLRIMNDVTKYFGGVVQQRTFKVQTRQISNINNKLNIQYMLEYFHKQSDIKNILIFDNDKLCEFDFIFSNCHNFFFIATFDDNCKCEITMYFCMENMMDKINDMETKIEILQKKLDMYVDKYGIIVE